MGLGRGTGADAGAPPGAPLDLAGFIRANLPVLPVPGVPEIRLHRAGPRSGLRRLAEADPEFGAPYWAHDWGGGLALARYILDRPETVSGRRVFDLGAGSGIVGIAAARAGAREVIAADVDPYAVAATGLNAALNGVAVSALHADPTAGPPPAVDVVAVGDLFYERGLAGRVAAFLDRCLALGLEVLIGDPWRAHLPRRRLRLLANLAVSDFGDAGGPKRGAVFAFEAEGEGRGAGRRSRPPLSPAPRTCRR